MAIWPLLYIDEKCESNILGQVYQKSIDISISFFSIELLTHNDVQYISQSSFS